MRRKQIVKRLLGGAAATLIGGCAHHPPPQSVVGTWAGTATENNGQTEPYKLAFSPDGREAMAMEVTKNGQVFTVDAGGSYHISGSTLTQTWSTIQMNGLSFPAKAGMVQTETYQFQLQGNTLTLTRPDSAAPLVLTRQGI